MKIIIGLGNPDEKYKNTFHNLGFMCVERAAELFGAEFNREKCRAQVAEARYNGEKIIFVKPQTYMNLSGESVSEIVNFYKVELQDILVMYDDYDLPLGAVRIRESGSAGTHNGMRNIVALLGSGNFARIRVGFKPLTDMKIPLISYVLSGISAADREYIEPAVRSAADAAADFIKGVSFDEIMQRHNGRGGAAEK